MSRDRSAAVWVGVAVGIGVLFLALVQIRAWVFDLQARVDKIAEDNKVYQGKMEGALASLKQPDQKARAESPPPDKPTPRKDPAVAEEPAPEKALAPPKPPPAKKKASTKPLRTYKVCYRIKKGENLSQISERFRVSVDQLRSWNGLKPTDTIVAGQALDIYTTTTTDRLGYMASARVSAKAASTKKESEQAPTEDTERQPPADDQKKESEGGETVADARIPIQKEELASTTENAYVVQPGENLDRIGRIHGMSWKTIAAENGIDNPNTIYAGQVLKIPER